MSGALSNLFSGNVIPPQPTGSNTTSTAPLWYQDLQYNIGNAASNLASQPYQPYTGQQVATPSDATQQSWNMATGNVGSWKPDVTQAQNLTNLGSALSNSALGYVSQGSNLSDAASGYLNQASGLSNGALGYLGNASNLTNGAQQYVGQGSNLTNAATGMTMGAAQPIGAGQISNYMNPYTSDVVGALQQASNYNLINNQLPAISSQFVGAGQAASPQMANVDNNALYQSNQALDQATAGALQSGYQQATGTALAEQQAGLQGANQLNQYGQAQAGYGNLQNTLGQTQAGYGSLQNQIGQTQAGYGSLQNTLGQTQAGYGALQNQIGAQVGTYGAQMGQLGALNQQLGAADTGLVASAGQAQDAVNQQNLNVGMQNFNAQQQWPYQNLAFASNITNGLNVPSNTQTVGLGFNPGQTYTASPLASFVGTSLGATAVQNGSNSSGALAGHAKGGRIRPQRVSARRAA